MQMTLFRFQQLRLDSKIVRTKSFGLAKMKYEVELNIAKDKLMCGSHMVKVHMHRNF